MLAEVYLELMGGRQPTLTLDKKKPEIVSLDISTKPKIKPARLHKPTEEEMLSHTDFINQLNKPIWHD